MRKLMWFAIGFGCACGICGYLFDTWVLYVGAAALILSILLLVGCRWHRFLRIPAAIILGFSVGIGWFMGYGAYILSEPEQLNGQTLTETMTVVDYSYDTRYGSAADLELRVEGKVYRIRVYLDRDTVLSPGDIIEGEFQMESAAGYLQAKGIHLTAVPRGDISVITPERFPVRHYPAIWRAKLLERIDHLFPEDTAAFAKALIMGERTDLDYETETAFRLSGISHIVAVSGLHVSILLALIYFVTGKNRFLSGIFGIPCLLLFAAMVGFTPSITRACVMQCLMLLALMCNREYDPPTALAFSGLMILTANPYAILSVSFQLSFSCVAGIFLFSGRIYRYLTERLGKKHKVLRHWLASSVSITLGANLVTTPLVACYFGAVSLVSILTNLVTLWVVTWIFYGILFSCGLSLLSVPVGSALAWIAGALIRFVTGFAKLLASFPLAAVFTESPYIVVWLVAAYALLIAFAFLKKRSVPVLGICITAMLSLSLLCAFGEPRLDECRVTVLDVGQGQAVILQSEGKTYLVDCGSDDPEAAADKAADHLMSMGVFRLDGMIVTHYDTDHVGGIPYLLTRIAADTVYLPKAGADEAGAATVIEAAERIFWVEDDVKWDFGEASIQLFAPETLDFGNESSVCILFQTENCDILITGDRSKDGELRLLQRRKLPELELLIAGHHGSKSATSDSLLALTSPEYVFISVGEDNRYGHPNREVLERLEEHGCTVYRTDRQGDLIFRR